MKTTLVQIMNGAILRREAATPGAPGHKAKGWYARHDHGKPAHNPDTHTCRAIESLAEQDEDVRYEVAPKPLADVRAWGGDMVYQHAASAIGDIRTPGLDVIYDAKREQMLEYFARKQAGEATPGEAFPNLSAMVGIDGATLDAVATLIRDKVAAENIRLAAIDAARRSAKVQIAAATTVEQVASIVESARAAIAGA